MQTPEPVRSSNSAQSRKAARSQSMFRTRKWLVATSLATVLALSAAGFVVSSQQSSAQVSVAVGAPASFADLVEAVKPSVVSISVDGRQEVRRLGSEEFFFQFPDLPRDHPLRKFFDQFEQRRGQSPDSPPRTRRFQAAGSGFIISADGLVVTNNHVIDNAQNITITDDSGVEYVATVVGTDRRTDLALLQIEGATDLPFVEFAEEDVRVGDWVLAVGNPFGLGGTVTAGIISARGRDIAASSYGDFLQIDAAINGGNSGGPTFNLSGKVVGVNTAIASPNGGNVGIAFAIPAQTVKQVITDLMDDGLVTRGFLGVGMQNVSKDIADSVGLNRARGAMVVALTDGGPAGKIGIETGDIILKVNGELIDDSLDLTRTVATLAPGTPVKVVVWRDGLEVTYEVVLDERVEPTIEPVEETAPEPVVEPEKPMPTSVGLTLMPNENGEGLVVMEITPDSIAAEKRFRPGDVLLEANGMELNSADEFEDIVASVRQSGRSTLLLKAMRGNQVRFLGLPV